MESATPPRRDPALDLGVRARPRPGRLIVRGKDALDYLHRMVSQDLRAVSVGHATLACVLTPQGRLVGLPVVWRLRDAIVLDLDAEAAAVVRDRLERTVITEDVRFEDASADTAAFDLVGADAPDVVAGLVADAPERGAHVAWALGEQGGRILRRDLGATPAFVLLGSAAFAAPALARLDARGPVPRLGEDAFDRLRVREGVPAWGAELGPEVMPLEARLEDAAISWSKGCYPGQEPVAMARHRGRPPNRLVRVAIEGAIGAVRGTKLLEGGREVGRITTIAGGAEGTEALAYVRTALADADGAFAMDGGGAARILPWPGEQP